MSRVLLAERKAAVLAPSQLACLAWLPTINLTAGCAHECLYRYARTARRDRCEGPCLGALLLGVRNGWTKTSDQNPQQQHDVSC